MAVTLFQSALLKLTVDQPFYDHLVHNLLLSYKRLIEKLIKTHDIATAREFVRAALRLEIRGRMAQDATFLRKFSGVFQDLGIVLLRNRLNQESVLCCRKVISVYPSPGSYVNLTNSLSAAGQRALTWTGLSSIMQLGRGQSGNSSMSQLGRGQSGITRTMPESCSWEGGRAVHVQIMIHSNLASPPLTNFYPQISFKRDKTYCD